MNKRFTGPIYKALTAFIAFGLLGSCSKTFDLEPQSQLERSQMYRNIYDADNALLGIYGQLLQLSEQYLILNELRGDLLDVTDNAGSYLREISNNDRSKISKSNPYADPRPFYKIIINCNDALKNFKEMYDKNLLNETQYYQRYTDVGLLRCWLYLQLGIHFGSVPYVTDPLDDTSDLFNVANFPRLSFDDLLTKLIEFSNTIPEPYLNQNTSQVSPTLIMPMDGYVIKDGVFKFFIHRRSLIGDLYLWKGNYLAAAEKYKWVMETGSKVSTNTTNYQLDLYDTYKITNDNSGRSTLMTIGTTNPWRNIFSNVLSEVESNRERMWTLPLDQTFAPQNPLINLFSASGAYLVKPSAAAINNWENQVRLDGSLTDRRGLNASYRMVGQNPEVLKYVSKYDPLNPFTTSTGVWILYRAATLHLRYAEAANRLGRSELAAALMNEGIAKGFASKISTYNGVPDIAPFDFDATQIAGAQNGIWYRNIGIRGRAVNKSLTIDPADPITDTENKLLNESALETAFEGTRWPDLLRVALRRGGDDGLAYINAVMKAKTGKDKTFTSMDDLYLPFTL